MSKAYVPSRKYQENYESWHWRVMPKLKENWLVVCDIRNLVNFHTSNRKSKNLHFHGLILSKAYEVLHEKVKKELFFMTLKSVSNFEEKLTLSSKNDRKNLVNFNACSGKSENLHFYVLFLSKVYYVSAKTVQRSYVLWHWRRIQTLKNLLEKWHEEFDGF